MPTIVGTPVASSTLVASSVTRTTLRRIIAGSAGLNGLHWGTASNGNATQGANTLFDASADGILDVAYDDDRFEGAWLYKCQHGTGVGYVAPELHRIASYSSSNGAVSIGRNFANPPVSGTTEYEIHTHGIPVDTLHEAIDWACDNTRSARWYAIPGLLSDGDMQATDVALWGSPSNATASKVILADEQRRVARVVASSGGYLPSTAIATSEGRVMRLHAVVEPASGAICSLVAWDATAGVTIAITWSGTVTQATSGRTYLTGRLEVPTGCASVVIRLLGSGDWYHVALYDVAHREVALPTWMVPYEQTIVAVAYAPGAGSASAHDGQLLTIPTPPRPEGSWWRIEPATYPGMLMVRASAPHPRLTNDDDNVSPGQVRQLTLGCLHYIYRVATRPDTMDSARYELARQQAQRDWQAMALWANPLARQRPRWGS